MRTHAIYERSRSIRVVLTVTVAITIGTGIVREHLVTCKCFFVDIAYLSVVCYGFSVGQLRPPGLCASFHHKRVRNLRAMHLLPLIHGSSFQPNVGTPVCFPKTSTHIQAETPRLELTAAWSGVLFFDSTIFCLTLYKSISLWRSGCRRLVHIILTDGGYLD